MKPTIDQITPAAIVAAKWWANRLRESAGVVDSQPLFDPAGIAREDVLRATTLDFFATKIRDKSGVTAKNCDEFERLLQVSIVEHLSSDRNHWRDCSGWSDGGPDMHLRVDYHPCEVLHSAMIAAGVTGGMADMMGLPFKTDMRVSARRVEVSYGYGAPWIEIYGPVWGLSRAEQEAYDHARYEAATESREWVDALFRSDISEKEKHSTYYRGGWNPPVWQGPIR